MKNGLIDRLKSKISRGVGIGLIGLMPYVGGCVHTTPQEAARLILKPTLTGNFEDWNNKGEITKIGNQGQDYRGNQGQGQTQPSYIAKLVPEIADSHICIGNCFGMDRRCNPSTVFEFQNTKMGELIKINAFAYFRNARGVPTKTILNNEDDKIIWVQDKGPNPYVEFNRMVELYLKRKDNDKGMKQYAVKWYGNGEFISQSNFFINWGN